LLILYSGYERQILGDCELKGNAISLLIIAGVTLSLALSVPLFADQSKKQNELGAEAKKIELPKQKAVKPLPEATMRLAGPAINEFSCASLTGGYNINLFGGHACTNCRLSVTFDIHASQGLNKFEITFRGNTVHEENFAGPAVSDRSARDMQLDLAPYRPESSGAYTLQAKVWDRRGQIATKSITLRVDMQRPRITSVRPANGETVYADGRSANIIFEIAASDDFEGIREVNVTSIAMADMPDNFYRGSDTTSPYSITISGVPLGEWSWRVLATDRAGNVTEYEHIHLHITARPASLPATKP
jgi:hypothetical protein